jgi:hypothetical protein
MVPVIVENYTVDNNVKSLHALEYLNQMLMYVTKQVFVLHWIYARVIQENMDSIVDILPALVYKWKIQQYVAVTVSAQTLINVCVLMDGQDKTVAFQYAITLLPTILMYVGREVFVQHLTLAFVLHRIAETNANHLL